MKRELQRNAVMGDDSAQAVLGAISRAWDVSDLQVVDASAFALNPDVNWTLTLTNMTLAWRAADNRSAPSPDPTTDHALLLLRVRRAEADGFAAMATLGRTVWLESQGAARAGFNVYRPMGIGAPLPDRDNNHSDLLIKL
jgi:hypothetical protein